MAFLGGVGGEKEKKDIKISVPLTPKEDLTLRLHLMGKYTPHVGSRVFIRHRRSENSSITAHNSPANVR